MLEKATYDKLADSYRRASDLNVQGNWIFVGNFTRNGKNVVFFAQPVETGVTRVYEVRFGKYFDRDKLRQLEDEVEATNGNKILKPSGDGLPRVLPDEWSTYCIGYLNPATIMAYLEEREMRGILNRYVHKVLLIN